MSEDIRKYWFIKWLLYPLSVLYGLLTDLRNYFYSSGIFKTWKSDVAVISIGNIIAGGTGKTPFTMLCIDLLKNRYHKIIVVSRGYGRQSKGLKIVSDGQGTILTPEIGGDEPVMIARKYPSIPVIVSEDRRIGIKMAQDSFHADLILLDDAFQHRRVARNCDLVIINSDRFLHQERLLPLGELREKMNHLSRAGIVILNNSQKTPEREDSELLQKIFNGPVFECLFKPAKLVNVKLEKIDNIEILKDKSVYIFCAIAGPEKFINMLTTLGVHIKNYRTFPDHHFYTATDFEQIRTEYQRLKCDYLVTTEKDMVKLEKSILGDLEPVAVSLAGEVKNPESFVDKLIQFIDIKI